MQTRLKLLPGQKGTKKLTQHYGDQLICVRYRYDDERKRRYKTVELIVDEVPWVRSRQRVRSHKAGKSDNIVSLRVDYEENHVRTIVKNAGGQWNRTERVWTLPYRKAVELGLERRIIS